MCASGGDAADQRIKLAGQGAVLLPQLSDGRLVGAAGLVSFPFRIKFGHQGLWRGPDVMVGDSRSGLLREALMYACPALVPGARSWSYCVHVCILRVRPVTAWLDATFMRGGTSKGLFFDERELPAPGPGRDRIFTSALGSPDPFGRQLDGMGGGISSLSKVVTVVASDRPGADVDYTFGQVAVGQSVVDYSGNCGNLAAAVVPFALLTGILKAEVDGPARVMAYNTNTGKLIAVQIHVSNGVAETSGDFVLPGVAGSGSPIELQYLNPGGSRTGTVLPTGNVVDVLDVGDRTIEVSLIDAATPMVFVAATDIGLTGAEMPDELDSDAEVMSRLDRIRRAGAVAMDLCTAPEFAPRAVPKVAIVAPPAVTTLLDGALVQEQDCDVLARVVSMEAFHRAIPGTSALCVATAANIAGTVVERCAAASGTELRIATPSGVVTCAAEVSIENGVPLVAAASLFRTARPLMRGQVAIPQ